MRLAALVARLAPPVVAGLVSGCASFYLHNAPPSPRAPWPISAESIRVRETAEDAEPVVSGRVYRLPDLIDLAESNNPDTRIGWQRARQAALAIGIPLAGYFPTVHAMTLAAYQHTIFPVPNLGKALVGANPSPMLPTLSFPLPMLPKPGSNVGIDTFQVLPFVLVNLEVLNLGRAAEVRAARHNSTAANALFTAEHEKVIFEVARAYFRLGAARAQTAVSREALERTRAVTKAAEARFAQGVATAVERAEAQRELAQGEYNVAQTEALEIAAHAALISALGIDPRAQIEVADNPSGPLPARAEQKLDEYIRDALATRADLGAARARLPASDAGVSRSKAAYAPHVDLFGTAGGAILGGGVGEVDLPTLKLPIFTAGVNVSWLLFDGGVRELQSAMARAQQGEAHQQLVKLQHQVVQEVITAYHEVNASLSRYQAATALLATAATADDAATQSYLHGLAALTEAMNAQKARALASAAKEQAYADALIAATTLAFAAGDLISAQAVPRSP